MKFGILSIENFARIKKVELDLSQPLFRQMVGLNEDTGASNEAGKTTPWNALSWCLYGRYPSGGGRLGDDVVNPVVGKDCMVQQQIIMDDRIVSVARTRKHSKFKNMVLISIKGKDVDEYHELDLGPKNVDLANKMIADIIGMDYETFCRSHYFSQEGIEPFGRMTDKELKHFFLEKLLNLSWLPDAYTSTKETLGYLEAHLVNETATINKLSDSIKEREDRINEYEEKNREWQQDREDSIVKTQSEIVDLEDSLEIIASKKSIIEAKMNELKLAISVMNDTTNWKMALQKAQTKLLDSTKRVAIMEPRVQALEKQIKEAEEKYEQKSQSVGSTCSACGNIIHVENLPHIMKVNLDIMKRGKKELDSVRVLYDEEVAEKNAIEGEIENLKAKVEEYDKNQKKAIELRDQYDELQKMTDEDSIHVLIATKKEFIKSKQEGKPPFEEFIAKEKAFIVKEMGEKTVSETQLGNLRKQIELHGFWNKAFSPSGIQSFILDSVTKIINSFITKYMKVLSDGRISARFSTVKPLKSGEFREKFGLEINNMDGSNTYGSLSGGAKRRVDIACTMAISKFIQQTSGKELKFVVLDEVISGMDEYWSDEFVKMLIDEYRGYSCWFVTHQPVNPVYFDDIVTVTKKDGVTSI